MAGYDIGQIGTEPNSLLFGMDYAIPMGYNSTVSIKGNDLISYINNLINNLAIQEKEIILIGSQAGSVNYEEGNLSRYNVDLYSFLLGANPDAIILCINPYDTNLYIKRTINFLEASVNTKVVGLVVYPMMLNEGYLSIYGTKKKLTNKEFEQVKLRINSDIDVPVYCLSKSDDMDILFNTIIDYFS